MNMISDVLDQYIDQEQMHSFEGERGVKNLTNIVEALGYCNLKEFLSDNSGAINTIVEWIGEQRCPEWKESLKDHINDVDFDEDLDDEDYI